MLSLHTLPISSVVNIYIIVNLLCRISAKDVAEESFKECLISKPTENFGYCLGVGALTKLQSVENENDYNIVDGITFSKDGEQSQYRETLNFIENDPGNLRTIIDTMDNIFSRRNLHWDMSYIYPGLAMRIAPSFSNGGVLEFALDQQRESLHQQHLKEVGTGRLLARQYLLPLLLGFKFNIATLLPLFFGAIALIISKAAILSKLAFVISSAYALSNAVFGYGNSNGNLCQPTQYQPTLNPSFGGHYNVRYKDEEHADSYYRNKNNGYLDQLKLHGNIPVDEVFAKEDKSQGRNFAWSEDESKKQT